MPILYSLVARDTHVLAECTSSGVTGNFTQITRELLPKLQVSAAGETRRSITSNKYNFHYITIDGIVYMCMADNAMGSVAPFRFLRDIADRFRSTYGERARTALAFSLNADFKITLRQQMDYWNSQGQDAKMRRIQEDIEDAQDQVKQGIEKLLDRSQRLEILVLALYFGSHCSCVLLHHRCDTTINRSTRRNVSTKTPRSTAARRVACIVTCGGTTRALSLLRLCVYGVCARRKNCKNLLFLFLLLAVLIWLLSSFICGFDYSKCGGGSKDKNQ
ncbi:MAG: hypothetical protein MHM6MM_002560 [Cercozoa sp. M6MM]